MRISSVFTIVITAFLLTPCLLTGQISINNKLENISYKAPQEYIIGGVTVSGTEHFDHNTIILISGLTVGETIKIPGDKITKAIEKLWEQKLFGDVKIYANRIEGKSIFLEIAVTEMPRLSKFKFRGLKKGQEEDIREEIQLIRGKVVTKNVLMRTENTIKNYFVEKGYPNVKVNIIQKPDTTLPNNVILFINVDKGNRVKIEDIVFHQTKPTTVTKKVLFFNRTTDEFKPGRLRRALKNTKRATWYNVFTISKYKPNGYKKELSNIIDVYNTKGYRDAKIVSDTVYYTSPERVKIEITVDPGNKYYFRNIKFIGNTKYSTATLQRILNIKKGEVYNKEKLEARLQMSPNGTDVSSLYLDNGYLFFSATPVETNIENDSIDIEIRIYEGKQARINRVTVVGNTKTNDHVVMREIRTKPGELFSRADIIRTQRELAQLGYFNPETLGVNPIPNQEDGTVDIEYTVEEKPSDQIELSGGWGAGRIVGTLGVTFNNFSARNFFKKGAWRPLPSGDGQRLSIRAQSNGVFFQSYNFSFTEPWLGGKKPNSFSISGFHSVQTNGQAKYITEVDGTKTFNPNRQSMLIYGASVGLGRRLKWPDDYFTLYNELSYQYYVLDNFSAFVFPTGFTNNLSFNTVFSRNSIDAPVYPRSGSQTTLTIKLTPPFSMLGANKEKDYSTFESQEKYKFIEYHKWKFQTQWFTPIVGNLVLFTKFGFGYLGYYNPEIGVSPFERFYLGGDGLSGFNLNGREIIRHRGYGNGDLSPRTGASVINKYTMEIRYPFSLNPSATIFGLAFVEAGNSWGTFKEYKPFELRRAAGVGIRIFMPMFGLLGLDWGYRFDDIPGVTDPTKRSLITFTIGGNIGGW